MPVDLSAVSDDGLILILLRVPIKDLIKICPQVSPQWSRILSERFFWRKKMEYDGYVLEWPKLVGLSTKSFQCIALKHCFGRNFIKDCWNLALQNEHSLTLDPRWNASRIIWQREHIFDIRPKIEIPPKFCDGVPEIPPGFVEPIPACVTVSLIPFQKRIIIKLADEGLTDEIMDNFRPTIVVSEMVGNRRDCTSTYQMTCSLEVNDEFHGQFQATLPNDDQREFREHRRDENGRWVSSAIAMRFRQSEAEGWHRMEHIFKDYPSGMRYLTVICMGYRNGQNPVGHYGLKLANCSVNALLEKNVQ